MQKDLRVIDLENRLRTNRYDTQCELRGQAYIDGEEKKKKKKINEFEQ